jgi:ATP-dependent Lon protease
MSQDAESAEGLPLLPLKSGVLFPHQMMPLVVGRPRSVAAIEASLATEDKTLLVVAQRDKTADEVKTDELYSIGTLAVLKRFERTAGVIHAIVVGTSRIKIVQVVAGDDYLRATFEELPEPNDTGPEIEALHREILDLARKGFELFQTGGAQTLNQLIGDLTDPLHHAYLLASVFTLDAAKAQALLAASTRLEALRLMHEYLTHEVQVLELRHQITSQTRSEMDKQQREYLLRQQLKTIQQELGESSPEEADTIELRKRIEQANLPDHVRRVIDTELARLERMSMAAADYQVTRTYVELVLELPWNTFTEDDIDLARARAILDEDHFDLEEVKDRIIEHLAVMKLNPQAKSPIICFLGPPGVGKTSLGQSIARSLGRRFERMSLGGLHDEGELRGHRRTYIGAMPGRIIQAIRRGGVSNPLLMLDEIDKLGRDYRGDPASALMEILDPGQNFEFRDNYLDLPFDLSRVFFITTANSLDTIPRPLLDRMEVLRLSGYSDEEKREIARRYLIHRQLAQAALTTDQLNLPDESLMYIIRRYTREAGVRELERMLGRIVRKVATRFAEGNTSAVTVSVDDLGDLLGPERFFLERVRDKLPPGVAAGLAWTESGGDVLYVEAVLLPETKDMTLTGQLGQVMQESAKAAQSFIRSQAESLGLEPIRLKETGVHIHVPAGAIPKDGPSAGITIATALASAYAGVSTRGDTAMTGELTLSGLVLPVGGIKEKVLAAHRAGIRHVILPAENRKDLRDLPNHVGESMEFTFVESIAEVLQAALPELAQRIEQDQWQPSHG